MAICVFGSEKFAEDAFERCVTGDMRQAQFNPHQTLRACVSRSPSCVSACMRCGRNDPLKLSKA